MPVLSEATAFSGVNAHAAAIDPKAAAAWNDAFRPIGTKMTKPLAGAITMEQGGNSYSYVKGMFLQQKGGAWEVVAAPVGAIVGEKPVGATTVFAGGKPYTYYAGTFFRSSSTTARSEPTSSSSLRSAPDRVGGERAVERLGSPPVRRHSLQAALPWQFGGLHGGWLVAAQVGHSAASRRAPSRSAGATSS